MQRTRRVFMKDMAAAGVAASVGMSASDGETAAIAETPAGDDVRCPYFDQPMYCKDVSSDGRPLCEE